MSLAALALVAQAEPPPAGAWRVWLSPRYMHSAAGAVVPGAKLTEFAGGRLEDDDLTPFTKTEFAALGLSWDDFFAKAREACAADLAALQPRYVRNRRQVIEYAVLESKDPVVASAVLAPKFLALFSETLGPKVLVSMPNQFQAFVFPALASDYQDYAPMVREAYRATAHPVSLEVLEFSAAGIKAIGAYDTP